VENYGVDPDIEVEFPPEAYAENADPQLESGIQEMLTLLEKEPVPVIQFDPANRRKMP
jgi:tricorn protease